MKHCASALALTIFGLATVGRADAAEITKGPYLQALDATGVVVKIELAPEGPAVVEITGAGKTKREVLDPTPARFHAIHVDHLTPSTSYDYRVRAGDVTSPVGHFTTAPADDRPFHFLVYGDSRSDPDAHLAVVRALQGVPSDFLVGTGDMVAVGDQSSDWAAFFHAEDPLLRDRCLFACVGNHELVGRKPDAAAFVTYFGPSSESRGPASLYGTFRWANTRFFLLNAMDEWSGEERAWLTSELDRAMAEPGLVHRIAVLHHGPFSSGPHGGNVNFTSGGVVALMRDRKVDLVLAGHDHIYERGEGQGLKYVISGGAGAPLYERSHRAPETLTFEAIYHYLDVSIDGDAVRILARRVSGSLIEACGFHGAGPWECDGAPAARDAPSASPTPTSPASPPAAAMSPPPSAGACRCDVPGSSVTLPAPWLTIAAGLAALRGRRRANAALRA